MPANAAHKTTPCSLPPYGVCALQSVAMLSKLGLALQEAKFYRALRWVGGFCRPHLLPVATLPVPLSVSFCKGLFCQGRHQITAQPGACHRCAASPACSFIGVSGRELNAKWDENGAGAVFFLEQEMSDGITGKPVGQAAGRQQRWAVGGWGACCGMHA